MATAFLISAGSSWLSSCSRSSISARSCFLLCSGIHGPWRRAGLLNPREIEELDFLLYAGGKKGCREGRGDEGIGNRGQMPVWICALPPLPQKQRRGKDGAPSSVGTDGCSLFPILCSLPFRP